MENSEKESIFSEKVSTSSESQNILFRHSLRRLTENWMPTSLCFWVEIYLGKYGYFCATHAWECICSIVTITLCVLSCNLLRLRPQTSVNTNSNDTYLSEQVNYDYYYSVAQRIEIFLCWKVRKIGQYTNIVSSHFSLIHNKSILLKRNSSDLNNDLMCNVSLAKNE